ncbi:MAG: AMP-binding protein [Flavobacteriales bacterium]|nr:AMP-binding protein [Flavobacteriales bacterium]MCB9449008.1 AMP-binding protein [Flavobacteriales bacterium]
MKNIAQLFLEAARKYPDHAAIIQGDRQIRYDQLAEQVRSTAGYFRKKGIKPGDRVLVFVPMGIDLYRIVLALFYMGAVAVFLDEWVSRERLALCCRMADCKAFVAGGKVRFLARFIQPVRKIPIWIGTSVPSAPAVDMKEVDESTSALITFTTGSTGIPKAADRTHGFLKAQFDALLEEINPQPGDVDMVVLPVVLLVNLGVGCTSVIAPFNARKPEKMKPDAIAGWIANHHVNRIIASPYFIDRLAMWMLDNKQTFSSVQRIFTGGAPVFPLQAQTIRQAFPDAGIRIVYGSTEAEPIASVGADELLSEGRVTDGLYVGKVFHRTQVSIIGIWNREITVSDEGQLKVLEVPPGKIGEIIVSGPHVLDRYYRNEEAFRRNKIMVDGKLWHRTGDSGYLGEDGRLYLTGRCEQIIRYGEKIYAPFVIEEMLGRMDGVELGTMLLSEEQHPVVVVELKKGADVQRVEEEVRNGIPDMERMQTVAKMPRDPRHHSKIDYEKLRKMVNG